MPTKFQCQKCKTWLEGNDAAAGEKMECPKCGNVLVVPRLPDAPEPSEEAEGQAAEQLESLETEEATDEEPVEDAEEAKSQEAEERPTPTYSFSSDNPSGSPIIWFVLLGVILAGLGYFIFQTSSKPDKKKDNSENAIGLKEDEVTEIGKLFDKARAAELDGRTEEAIDLYQEYLIQAEKLPANVKNLYDLDGVRETIRQLQAGESTETPKEEGEPASEQPAAQ